VAAARDRALAALAGEQRTTRELQQAIAQTTGELAALRTRVDQLTHRAAAAVAPRPAIERPAPPPSRRHTAPTPPAHAASPPRSSIKISDDCLHTPLCNDMPGRATARRR